MPYIRTVKPELFAHEPLFEAEHLSELPLRLSFIGLFCQCDRLGRFRWRPRELKSKILPHDSLDFGAVLNALVAYGFVVTYHADDEQFGCIPTFLDHQKPNIRERLSVIPAPPEQSEPPKKPPKSKPAKPAKPRKQPTGDHAALIDHWCNAYKMKYGKAYTFTKGRDGAHAKTLLEAHPLADVTGYVDYFFKHLDEEEWMRGKGANLGIFLSQINKLTSGEFGASQRPSADTGFGRLLG